jgi:tetratricopeptide (TPR) repeat protein
MSSFDEALEEANLALFDGDFDDAHSWLDDADDLAADDIHRARALELRGCVLIGERDYDEAVTVLVRAIEMTDDTLMPSPASVWGNLGYALDMQQSYEAAEAAHRECIEMYEESEGPDHPQTLRKLGDLAFSLIGQRKLDEAESLLRRAVEGFNAQIGREPGWHVRAISNLGYFLLRSRGDAASALQCFDRAEALYAPGEVRTMVWDKLRQNRAEAEAALTPKM